jgi:hypothetical protein
MAFAHASSSSCDRNLILTIGVCSKSLSSTTRAGASFPIAVLLDEEEEYAFGKPRASFLRLITLLLTLRSLKLLEDSIRGIFVAPCNGSPFLSLKAAERERGVVPLLLPCC